MKVKVIAIDRSTDEVLDSVDMWAPGGTRLSLRALTPWQKDPNAWAELSLGRVTLADTREGGVE